MSLRYDWYQTDTKVVILVMLKYAANKNYAVQIDKDKVCLTTNNYDLLLKLHKPVLVEHSGHKDDPSKIEITLAKEVAEQWTSLEQKELPINIAAPPPPMHKKNWDSLAKEVERTEEEEAQNEEALQRLFKKIYRTSSPEVRMAMNKSFTESGGTVLSTNWQEVSKSTVEMKPPEGVEIRKWK